MAGGYLSQAQVREKAALCCFLDNIAWYNYNHDVQVCALLPGLSRVHLTK